MPLPQLSNSFEIPGYFNSATGLILPKSVLNESKSKAIQVSTGGYLQFYDEHLEQFIRYQLAQSRRKYFIFGEMYRRSVWVRACVDWLTDSAAGIAPDRLVDRRKAFNPDIEDLNNFFEDCHPLLTLKDIKSTVYRSLYIHAQAYIYVEKDKNGDPLHLWPLDPRITFPITDTHGTVLFHAQVYNGKVVALMPEEVLYFAIPNNGTEANSLSPLETIYDSVNLQLNADAYNAALFENDLNLGMVFAAPSADKEIVDENDRILVDKYSKPENAGRHLILYGDMKLLRDGAAALKDINFSELMHQCMVQAFTVYRVPPTLLGIQSSQARAVVQVHERSTYVSEVRPMRQFVNAHFTKQFIRSKWGSKDVEMVEPIGSMLAHPEQIEAASKVADMGVGTYNEYRQLLGLEEVPNGDYPGMKIPGAGGFIRPDQTAFPGLMDEHFDFAAYVREHEAQEAANQSMQAAGMQPSVGTPYVAPMSYDAPQEDPIAARIIDISRSLNSGEEVDGLDMSWVVYRRNPVVPGARGGQVYFTKNGQPRYGPPPKGPRPSTEAKDGTPSQNSLTNPKDPNTPKRLTPEEKAQVQTARTQVQTLLGKALDENWSDEQFFSGMQSAGWESVSGADHFTDVRDARAAAQVLSERYPDNVYTLLGSEGQYKVMSRPISDVSDEMGHAGKTPTFGAGTTSPTPVPGIEHVGRSSLFRGNDSRDSDSAVVTLHRLDEWRRNLADFLGVA